MFYINIVMNIMQEIYLTDDQSHQHLISSMVPSLTGVPRNNPRPLEAVSIHKQEQYTQEY